MTGLASRLAPAAGGAFSWRDALDILAVALVVYALLLLIRGTRAVPMLVGILVILVVY